MRLQCISFSLSNLRSAPTLSHSSLGNISDEAQGEGSLLLSPEPSSQNTATANLAGGWHGQGGTTALLLCRLGRHVPVNLVVPCVASCSLNPSWAGSAACHPTLPRHGSWCHRRSQQDHAALPGQADLGSWVRAITCACGLCISSIHHSLLGTR